MSVKVVFGAIGIVGAVVVAAYVTGARSGNHEAAASGTEITVYKSPACGCCGKWIEHLQAAGFQVKVMETPDANELIAVKERHGITPQLAACHTALVGDYVVEGHVPADVIKKMLAEHPAIRGIAVPGMPVGSPGMEGPAPQHYDVLAFDAAGHTSVYASR